MEFKVLRKLEVQKEVVCHIVRAPGNLMRTHANLVATFHENTKIEQILTENQIVGLTKSCKAYIYQTPLERSFRRIHETMATPLNTLVVEAISRFKQADVKLNNFLTHYVRSKLYPDFHASGKRDRTTPLYEINNMEVYFGPTLLPELHQNAKPIEEEYLKTAISKRNRVKPRNSCPRWAGLKAPTPDLLTGHCALNAKINCIISHIRRGYMETARELTMDAKDGPLREMFERLLKNRGVYSQEVDKLRQQAIVSCSPLLEVDHWDTNGIWEYDFFRSETVLLRKKSCPRCPFVEFVWNSPPHLSSRELRHLLGLQNLDAVQCPDCGADLKHQMLSKKSTIVVDVTYPNVDDRAMLVEEFEETFPETFQLGDETFNLTGYVVDEIDEELDGEQELNTVPDNASWSILEIVDLHDPETLGVVDPDSDEEDDQQNFSHNFFAESSGGVRHRIDDHYTVKWSNGVFEALPGFIYRLQYVYYARQGQLN